jgi:CMP-N-acetylneuraminate monooxygenase
MDGIPSQAVQPPALNSVRLCNGLLDLGPANAIASFPARVEIGGLAYFLTHDPISDSDGYRLLSTVCPHLGSEITDVGDCFECPNHGWRFDHFTGRCITSPGQDMASIPVHVIAGHLLVDLPTETEIKQSTPSRTHRPRLRVKNLSISLHAHACLEFNHHGFSLLTDPWLEGPAFLGAWTQYPPPIVDAASLHPSAIWISHEHSDHFHEPTLARFDRYIPIYTPDFPNRRIINRLRQMGFKNAIAMPFGQTIEIADKFRLTCYEPASLWNDAVVLIEIDGLRFLNLNDAGLNRRIARAVAPVDVIASSFSPGASGYPLTWTHLSDQQKSAINERSRQGILHMLKEAVEMYGGKIVLPFAGHFSLWHPSHEPYVRAMRKNTVDDVVEAFKGHSARVVDLLPGEAWHVEGDTITRAWKRRNRLYESDRQIAYLRRNFDADAFTAHHPQAQAPARSDIERYFLSLNRTAEIAFCEDLTVTVRQMPASTEPDFGFAINGGKLRILPAPADQPNLLIEIPPGILRRILTHNLSWDEAHIGYWCRFSRQPDVFHAGFWRLLQAPYFAKPAGIKPDAKQNTGPITGSWILADILEKFGDRADRIIRRYGLYCAGCQHSTADTIAQGARQHGLDDSHLVRLLRDLNEGTAHLKPT